MTAYTMNNMSANRLLLQRLSAAPTLQQIRPHHHQPIRRGITSLSSIRWGTNNRSSADADVVSVSDVHYRFAYPNNHFERRNNSASLFSSIASTSPLEIPEDDTNTSDENENRKPDNDASETNSDEDDASSAGEKEKEISVSAAEAEGSTTAAQADDNTAENDAPPQSSTDSLKSDVIPSEKVIRSGFVKWIDDQKNCCVVIQDKKYQKLDKRLDNPKLQYHRVFLHFEDIHPHMKPILRGEDLQLRMGEKRRLKFQAKPKGGSRDLRGFNVTFENGDQIPILSWTGAFNAIKRSKSHLGNEVYDIMSSESVSSEDEMALKINTARRRCDRRIEWAKRQIVHPHRVLQQAKAQMGEEIYDVLSNIAEVGDVAKKVDESYFKCLKTMAALEMHFSPEEIQGSREDDHDNKAERKKEVPKVQQVQSFQDIIEKRESS